MAKDLNGLAAGIVRRLYGIKVEASAVYNLTIQFGGGKTHVLTLLYHLASGVESGADLGEQIRSCHSIIQHTPCLPATLLFLAAADFGNPDIQEFFNGTLDEIWVYNLALSQAEIQSDMNTLIPRGLIRVSPLRPLICPTSTASVDK
ncbi:MAG: hypothetical protein OJF51_000080 [Nitrospira sp.]|nr:MAG: hypothetical protein OJF51_000080 [Nitrospira sp.]